MNLKAHFLALKITLIISGTLLFLSYGLVQKASSQFDTHFATMVSGVTVNAVGSPIFPIEGVTLGSGMISSGTILASGAASISALNLPYPMELTQEDILIPFLSFISAEKERIMHYMFLGFSIFFVFLYLIAYLIARNTLKPIEQARKSAMEYSRYIAHEIRTPLLIISSDLEILGEIGSNKQLIERTIGELHGLSTVVDGLLFLALNEHKLHQEYVELKPIVEGIWGNLQKQYTTTIQLHEKYDNGTIFAHPTLLYSLIHNLLENAIKYNTGNDIFFDQDNHSIHITNPSKPLPPERKKGAFEPFVGEREIGYGLGLSLVKRIIDIHKWSIDILYNKNIGTTIEIVTKKG